MLVHAAAGMIADVDWIKKKLREVIPKLEAGLAGRDVGDEWPF